MSQVYVVESKRPEEWEAPRFAYEHEGHYYLGALRVEGGTHCGGGEDEFGPAKASPLGLRAWLEREWKPLGWHDWPGTTVREHPLQPGQFFPRIWRPGWSPDADESTRRALRESCLAARPLLKKLDEVFLTAVPDPTTEAVYGHEIRQLLLLACMEVESAWASVLRANGQAGERRRDYVKLLRPMALGQYEVSLTWYPSYPSFRPFDGWKPDGSGLRWYQAYNRTKHDREQNLDHATLGNAIRAMAGLVVMLYAQFGPLEREIVPDFDGLPSPVPSKGRDWRAPFEDVFTVDSSGVAGALLDEEFLIPPIDENGWSPVNYPLTGPSMSSP